MHLFFSGNISLLFDDVIYKKQIAP